MSATQLSARLVALRKARKNAKANLRLHRDFILLETENDADFLAESIAGIETEIAGLDAQIAATKAALQQRKTDLAAIAPRLVTALSTIERNERERVVLAKEVRALVRALEITL